MSHFEKMQFTSRKLCECVCVCVLSPLLMRRLGAAAANYNAATYIPSLETALFLPSPPKVDVSIVSLATAHDYSGARVRKLISPESLSAIAASVDGSVLAGGKIPTNYSYHMSKAVGEFIYQDRNSPPNLEICALCVSRWGFRATISMGNCHGKIDQILPGPL